MLIHKVALFSLRFVLVVKENVLRRNQKEAILLYCRLQEKLEKFSSFISTSPFPPRKPQPVTIKLIIRFWRPGF